MASGHPQAYLSASEVIAASPELDPAGLDLPDPGGDALLVVQRNGLGRVAAWFAGDFTHVVARVDGGVELWNAEFWREEGVELEELDQLRPGPLNLARALDLLADAPHGVREALIDAAVDGPVALVEADEERRAAWIAWITAVLPEASFTTFATRPIDVRVCATTPEHAGAFPHAFDTGLPVGTQPSRFAQIATAVAVRDPVALGGEPDPVALAVRGGATDLLTPEDLPRALELITDLARRGEVATAARAAAGLGAAATALVPAEAPALEVEVHVERAAEPPDAEVVEAEVVEVVAWPAVEKGVSLRELEAELAPPPAASLFEGISLRDFAAALERQSPKAVERSAPEPVPEPEPRAVREDTFGGGLPLHDLEHPAPPAPFVPASAPEPEPAESGRSLEELMAAFTEDPLEAPEADGEPVDEVTEETELGISLSELEATLEVDEEVGMSLEDFEASLKRERDS